MTITYQPKWAALYIHKTVCIKWPLFPRDLNRKTKKKKKKKKKNNKNKQK